MCRAIGRAMARFAGAPEILIARDMRESGVALSEAFSDGVRSEGCRGHRPRDGVHRLPLLRRRASRCSRRHVTASHNPARYNGMKLCLSGARPVGRRHRAGRDPGDRRVPARQAPGAPAKAPRRERNLLDEWAEHVHLLRRPGLPAAAQGRRRHRQRHGGFGRSSHLLQPPRSRWRSSSPSSTATFPTTRPTRSSRRTSRTCKAAVLAPGGRHRAGLRRRRRPGLFGR